MEIIFATQNKHKITEISSVLGKEFHIISLEDIGCLEELPETQDTFEGNAKQKAFYIYEHYHKNCFADDSGLEIEALNGKPGIYSARYAGNDKDMEANIDKVLYEMKDVTNRKAQFRTVIALVIGENDYETCSSFIFEGIIGGSIIKERRGTNGFGYDPIFIPDGFEITFAEMSLEAKNKISHRAIAVGKLKAMLTLAYGISES
jgi:XTP/dITP diphosphohydrolase